MMNLTAWNQPIEGFLLAQSAAGLPATTRYTRRQHLENLARWIGVADPWDVTADQLEQFVGSRGWARETLRSRRTTFVAFWRWGQAKGFTTVNPALLLPRVRPSLPNPLGVPDDVYWDALSHADERESLILRLAAEMGLRRGEIAQVHSRDVVEDLLGWSLVVHGKGEKPRWVPFPALLAEEVRALPPGYAFPGAVNGHLSARRVGELATDLLADEWTIHKLRHRAAQRWYDESNGDVIAVQQGLGHASPATTIRYVRPSQARLRRLVVAAAA